MKKLIGWTLVAVATTISLKLIQDEKKKREGQVFTDQDIIDALNGMGDSKTEPDRMEPKEVVEWASGLTDIPVENIVFPFKEMEDYNSGLIPHHDLTILCRRVPDHGNGTWDINFVDNDTVITTSQGINVTMSEFSIEPQKYQEFVLANRDLVGRTLEGNARDFWLAKSDLGAAILHSTKEGVLLDGFRV